jgi:hypothetical protein
MGHVHAIVLKTLPSRSRTLTSASSRASTPSPPQHPAPPMMPLCPPSHLRRTSSRWCSALFPELPALLRLFLVYMPPSLLTIHLHTRTPATLLRPPVCRCHYGSSRSDLLLACYSSLALHQAHLHLAAGSATASSVEFPDAVAVAFCRYYGRGWNRYIFVLKRKCFGLVAYYGLKTYFGWIESVLASHGSYL